MADLIARARQLASTDRAVDGALELEKAVGTGSGEAALELAYWRLSGQFIRRDLRLARSLFQQASDLGIAQARPIATALLANGAGGSGRRWAEAVEQLRTQADPTAILMFKCIAAMHLDNDGKPLAAPDGETLRTDPDVRSFEAFMTAEECACLVQCAEPMMQPSVVVHPKSGALIRDPVRTSDVASFPFVLENPFVHAINQRIAAATSTSVEQGEPLQVLRYGASQQYKLHSDALRGEMNQRQLTFLVYLSDAYDGGHTSFPDLNLRYRGGIGDALAFSSVRADGTVHPLARHAGEPVTRGHKYLLSRWIRQNPLDLSGPPGRPL